MAGMSGTAAGDRGGSGSSRMLKARPRRRRPITRRLILPIRAGRRRSLGAGALGINGLLHCEPLPR
jgi:hypothetical protein